jgi:hypothetical protein
MSSKPCTWADASHEFPGIETSWRIFCGTSGPDRPKPYVELRLELESRRLHVIQVDTPGKDAGPRWVGEATAPGMYKWEYRYLRPRQYSSRQEAVLRHEFRYKTWEQAMLVEQYNRIKSIARNFQIGIPFKSHPSAERNPFGGQSRPYTTRLLKRSNEILDDDLRLARYWARQSWYLDWNKL